MENIFLALARLEMLCVNLYTFHRCSEKKSSSLVTVLVLSGFTILFFALNFLILERLRAFGSGAFIVFGMLYLLPLLLLYHQPLRYTITIMCYVWIYTSIFFALSVQLSALCPLCEPMISRLIIQTVLYLLTIRPFERILTEKFRHILIGSDKQRQTLVCLVGILWFFFFVLLNLEMTSVIPSHGGRIVKILILCSAAVSALMTYELLFSFHRERQTVKEYEQALRVDMLTGLKNRTAFLNDAQSMIEAGQPFTIFFIDLDQFKAVNDSYGHLVGDQYLKQFSASLSASLSSHGTVYRISGDEFICLSYGAYSQTAHRIMEDFHLRRCGGAPFYGFSTGTASYPEEAQNLDDLIFLADNRMYKMKVRSRTDHG